MAWLETNKKRLLIWGGAGLGIALIVVAVVMQQKQREVRASEALSEIKVPANLSADPSPEALEAHLKLARDYAGTEAAGRALLLYASFMFNQKDFGEAQARFEEFVREYPNSRWLPQAMFGVAASLDAQKKAGEAIAKYEDLRRRFQTHAIVDEARLCLARLYEDENRLEEAMQIYNELVQTHTGSGMGAEAGMRREDLLERFPELAKTNVPSLTTIPSADLGATGAPVTLLTNLPQALTNQAGSNLPIKIELKTTPEPGDAVPAPQENEPGQ